MPHPLIDFEIQKYYQNKPKFKGDYSRNNSPETKNVTYVINLDEYKSIGTHGIGLYVKTSNDAAHFDSFGVEHVPKEVKKFIGSRSITIMCGCFCIRFIHFMLKCRNLLDYTNLLLREYEKNGK